MTSQSPHTKTNLAEYDPPGGPAPQVGIQYVTADQLGSTRLVTGANGNVVSRYDYSPFGEELWADGDVRTLAMGYQAGPDGFNPKFTGQYPTESPMDYFNARYYSPAQGRLACPIRATRERTWGTRGRGMVTRTWAATLCR